MFLTHNLCFRKQKTFEKRKLSTSKLLTVEKSTFLFKHLFKKSQK